MHLQDMILYGHLEIIKATEKLPLDKWELPNACGIWSVKNIIAHLASYELMLLDVLYSLLDENSPTPTLNTLFNLGDGFNDAEVDKRKTMTASDTFKEYMDVHEQVMQVLPKISPELATKAGTLAWYGENYDLDDFVVYTSYGHKREHSTQINAFWDILKRGGS